MTARPPLSTSKPSASRTRPTMRDVARLAGGVHPSTVSLALRNHPGISEATRKRVCAAARKLGYRPDPLLDAFNTHRLEVLPHKALPVIAFVADFESRQALEKSPHHGPLWAGARAAAETLRCHIELFLIGKTQLTPERVHSILLARGIVSLVIGACRPMTNRLAFDWSEYSAVKIESPHLNVPLYTVSSDQRQAARLSFRQLHAAGYRRIGLATTPGNEVRQDDFYRAGYFLEQSRCHDTQAIPPLDLNESTSPGVVVHWIRQNRVQVVMSDAFDLPAKLATEGLRVPQDVAYVNLCLPAEATLTAGIVPDYARVGAQAAEQVVGLMRTNQRGLPAAASCTFVPVSWRDGESAPHAPVTAVPFLL